MEIYVLDLSESDAVAWLSDVFDDVSKQPDVPVATYDGTFKSEPVSVQITEHVKGGDYTSVWFRGDTLPWERAADCARAAHDATGHPALGYVEDRDKPWTMIRVNDDGAHQVDARDLAF